MEGPLRVGILAGTTASGKTALAVEWAQKLAGQGGPHLEIINADSLLVYRELSIGTAKPSVEEQAGIPHHLIDVCGLTHEFTAAEFAREARRLISEIHGRGNRALIVGGTGFYLKALLHGLWEGPGTFPEFRATLADIANDELFKRLKELSPATADRIHPNDRYRLIRALEVLAHTPPGSKTPAELEDERPSSPDPLFELWILDRETTDLENRIQKRAEQMIDCGLVDEVRRLLPTEGEAPRPLKSVGYRQVIDYLAGVNPPGRKIATGPAGLISEISLATRQLVKAQRTFFKGQFPYAKFFILPAELSQINEEAFTLYMK